MSNSLIVDKPQRRVVCAAVTDCVSNLIICGPRHFDTTMRNEIARMSDHVQSQVKYMEQGFVDQWGKFMTREEAFEVATVAGQIRHKSGNPDSKELFSEDIY